MPTNTPQAGAPKACPSAAITSRPVKGRRTAARWFEKTVHAITEASKAHRLGGVAKDILLLAARDQCFGRYDGLDDGEAGWNYTPHQIAKQTGRSRTQVNEQLTRLQSLGLAQCIRQGHRGRPRKGVQEKAGLWELKPIGPAFSEVADQDRSRKRAARMAVKGNARSQRSKNVGNALIPPSGKKSTFPKATSISSHEGAPVAVAEGTPEGKLLEAMLHEQIGKGGALTAIRELRKSKLSNLDLEAFAQSIGLVLKAIQDQIHGKGSAQAVLVHRCKLGEGRALIRLGKSLVEATSRRAAEEVAVHTELARAAKRAGVKLDQVPSALLKPLSEWVTAAKEARTETGHFWADKAAEARAAFVAAGLADPRFREVKAAAGTKVQALGLRPGSDAWARAERQQITLELVTRMGLRPLLGA